MINTPNLLSLFRIIVIPIIIFLSFLGVPLWALVSSLLFTIAALSDFLDGYLARKYSMESKLGSFLDLIADKLLIVSLLIWLTYSINSLEMLILSLILVSRELVISSLRQFAQSNNPSLSFLPNKYGKIKTLFQMISVSILLLTEAFPSITLYQTGIFLLTVSALLSLFSLITYLKEYLIKL